MPDVSIYNGHLIRGLMQAMRSGESGLKEIPMLIKKIIRDDLWSRFTIEPSGELVTHGRFLDFVIKKPLGGLGSDLKAIRRLCADDADALDSIDKATQGKHGGDRKSEEIKGVIHPLDLGTLKRERNSKHLRRLRKDFPSLHKAVIQGELTVNAAAVKAGIYPTRATINLLSADSAARTILSSGSDEFVQSLMLALQKYSSN